MNCELTKMCLDTALQHLKEKKREAKKALYKMGDPSEVDAQVEVILDLMEEIDKRKKEKRPKSKQEVYDDNLIKDKALVKERLFEAKITFDYIIEIDMFIFIRDAAGENPDVIDWEVRTYDCWTIVNDIKTIKGLSRKLSPDDVMALFCADGRFYDLTVDWLDKHQEALEKCLKETENPRKFMSQLSDALKSISLNTGNNNNG